MDILEDIASYERLIEQLEGRTDSGSQMSVMQARAQIEEPSRVPNSVSWRKIKLEGIGLPMKINKKIIVVVIITIIVFFTITLIGVYWHNHPTHYLYEDRWIIGKSAYQIKQRYGEFDKHFGSSSKGYCVKPSTTDWWGDATWPEYYMIYFDENGIAYNVEIVVGGWGG